MIDWQEARARILALGAPVGSETLSLAKAAGRWAAADVVAQRTQPARDLSSMDGYAIRFDDLPGPWRVVGTAAAGAPYAGSVRDGEAARIFTGAALPDGSDTVIIQEDVSRDGDTIASSGERPAIRAAHVRPAGSDFSAGQVLIAAGARLTPARIGLAAAGGHGNLSVARRVRVALLSTGDELVPPGVEASDDRLPDANGAMLAALLSGLPVDVIDLGIVPDAAKALASAFARASDFDILLTSGGASVGDHDLVRPALLAAGASIDFWKVAMRPGKPLMAGTLGTCVVLGLPGNPVSAFVTAMLFLKPLAAQLSGAAEPLPPMIAAELAAPLPEVGARTDFVRARWERGRLVPLLSTDSGALAPLALADALIMRAAGSAAVNASAHVEAILLD